MMVNEQFNNLIFQLWKETFNEDDDIYVPLIYPNLQTKSILFIGLNPSFITKGFASLLIDSGFSNINPVEFYHWKNTANFSIEKALEIEKITKAKYRYFNKFRDISSYVGIEWEHIDLFFFRETSQNDFKKRILNGSKLNKFGNAQIKLADFLISEISPKIVIVANAFASDIFKKEFKLEFDEQLGCHLMDINQTLTPVFLGSMLTGQRAMDKYSYERLRWHTKKVLNSMK